MHRFAPQLCRIGLAAQSARRQPKNSCDFGKNIGQAGSTACQLCIARAGAPENKAGKTKRPA
jgi:hypothetical protein